MVALRGPWREQQEKASEQSAARQSAVAKWSFNTKKFLVTIATPNKSQAHCRAEAVLTPSQTQPAQAHNKTHQSLP